MKTLKSVVLSAVFFLIIPFNSFSAGYNHGLPVFTGVTGFGLDAVGGKGGRIIVVSNLNKDGEGSLADALNAKGPRIIVFEVAGVIDLEGKSIRINNPFVTIAGQTAPYPGITLIKGGLYIATHEVIIQHLKSRPGEAGRSKKSGWEVDGISTGGGAYNIIIDHCSCSWATDENLSVSGPRFMGKTVDEWRRNTSHKITISNCIISQGLSLSTHSENEHSKGSLVHDNTTEILFYGNLFANNMERNPLCKGGSQTAIINNYVYNPGKIIFHYALNPGEWAGHDFVKGKMTVEGNYVEYGRNTSKYIVPGLFFGSVEVYWKNNEFITSAKHAKIVPKNRRHSPGLSLEEIELTDVPPLYPTGLIAMSALEAKQHVLENAGAFPWKRDDIDSKIIEEVISGKGKIIDSESEAGGYPEYQPVYRKFNVDEWELTTMTKKDGIDN